MTGDIIKIELCERAFDKKPTVGTKMRKLRLNGLMVFVVRGWSGTCRLCAVLRFVDVDVVVVVLLLFFVVF